MAASIYYTFTKSSFKRRMRKALFGNQRVGVEVNFLNVFADSCADCDDDADNDGSSVALTKAAKLSRKHN